MKPSVMDCHKQGYLAHRPSTAPRRTYRAHQVFLYWEPDTQLFTLLPNPCHIYWRESNRLALFTSTVLVWNLISPESVAFENPKRRDEAKIGQDRTGVVGHLGSTRGRWEDGIFQVTGEERF